MGNPLLKLYSVDKDSPAIEGGRFLRWKIYKGHHRDRGSSSLVSLFCFDKKVLSSSSFSSSLRASLLSLLQQEAHLLQRLRHPRLLHLLEPLQEDKSSLVFCTRLVDDTLRTSPLHPGRYGSSVAGGTVYTSTDEDANGYSYYSRNGTLPSKGSDRRCDGDSMDGRNVSLKTTRCFSLLEVKSGILDIAEALHFLHADAQLVHLNINSDSVFLTPQGQWRLGGLGFALELPAQSAEGLSSTNLIDCAFVFGGSSGSAQAAVSVVPPLYYSAPELSATKPGKCCRASDIFSLGLLMAEVLLGGDAGGGESRLLKTNEWDVGAHQAQCQRLLPLRPNMFSSSPYFRTAAASASLPSLTALLSSMLSHDPAQRPTIEQVLGSPFFQDMNMRALRFLEALHEKDENQKIQFLKGFLPLIQQEEEFHHDNLLRNRVLSPLLDALSFPPLYPFVLPVLFFVVKKLDDTPHFQTDVWPRVKPLLTAREIQVESVLFLMNELDFLMAQCTEEAIQQDLLPLLVKCMQIPEPRLQETVLARLSSRVYQKFDYTALRTAVLPRVLNLIQQASSSSVRIQGLSAVTAMASAFDRSTIVDQIVTVIQEVSKVDRSGPVSMAVCSTLDTLSHQVGLKVTTERLLHVLLPLLMEEDLDAGQFDHVYKTVLAILSKVETTRRKHFALQSEQASAVAAALPPSSVTPRPPPSTPSFLSNSIPSSASLCSPVSSSEPLPFEALLMSPTSCAPVSKCRATPTVKAPQPPPPPPPPCSNRSGYQATVGEPLSSSAQFGSSSQPLSCASDPFLLSASFGHQPSGTGRQSSSSSAFDCLNAVGSDSSASKKAARPSPSPSASKDGRSSSGSDVSHRAGLDTSFLFAAPGLPATCSSSDGECTLAPLPKLPSELFGSSLAGGEKPQGRTPELYNSRPTQSGRATGAHSGEARSFQGKNDTCTTSTTPSSSRASSCKTTQGTLEDLLGGPSFPTTSSSSWATGSLLNTSAVGSGDGLSSEAGLRDAFQNPRLPASLSPSTSSRAARNDPFAGLSPLPEPSGRAGQGLFSGPNVSSTSVSPWSLDSDSNTLSSRGFGGVALPSSSASQAPVSGHTSAAGSISVSDVFQSPGSVLSGGLQGSGSLSAVVGMAGTQSSSSMMQSGKQNPLPTAGKGMQVCLGSNNAGVTSSNKIDPFSNLECFKF
ncbi:scy kinase-related protein (incomplete catalytic triad) [Cystoisospora suis]|uniref:Scy kinase-related protein (Incomplete catalytic triad) n=1 Tax=Cystoisospora suis TaxID=483139 RepID=A0A2C6KIH1_9APIC|nr:scy kinase-related protein (incomplete catalytic triad) [Cystoisospora suis]